MKTWSVVAAVTFLASASAFAAEEAKTAAPAAPAAAAATAEPAASSSASGVSVEAKVCKNLQNREPVDVTDSFKVSDGQVITYSKVTGAAGSEIHHVYFLGDKQVDDIKLKIGGSPWRTNSKKTLRADTGIVGDWRVEVRDANGSVLETLKFKVE